MKIIYSSSNEEDLLILKEILENQNIKTNILRKGAGDYLHNFRIVLVIIKIIYNFLEFDLFFGAIIIEKKTDWCKCQYNNV